jgi:hypothetical protein
MIKPTKNNPDPDHDGDNDMMASTDTDKDQGHPGFKKVAKGIAAKEGVGLTAARAILAAKSRSASPAAKKANPNLKRVK